MRRVIQILFAAFLAAGLNAQNVTTFEMRYLTKDPKADGITDFHGDKEWFDTEQRVDVLGRYTDYASRFWGDPGLDRPLFSDADVLTRLASIKPQPSTSVRRTIRLDKWKAYGFKTGKGDDVKARWERWTSGGAKVNNGCLVLDGTVATLNFKPLDWRFRIKASLPEDPFGLNVSLAAGDGETISLQIGSLREFEIYGDLVNHRIFLSSEGKTIKEIPCPRTTKVIGFSIGAPEGKASLESIMLYSFTNHQEDNPSTPYWTEMVFDEDFESVPSMTGWQDAGYDDSAWELVRLPSPHGGFRGAGEDYYLRTRVKVGGFKSASLMMETLDPGGEVWVNGRPAAVLNGRLPRKINVSEYLIPESENTIAVRVKPFYTDATVFHAPNDHNFGWFLGRSELILSDASGHITEGLVHTASLEGSVAVQHHKVTLKTDSARTWDGSLVVNYYPWFPVEGPCIASQEKRVELRPNVDNEISIDIPLESPELWYSDSPKLYKVEIILKDSDGKQVDDLVTTTGVRLIEQKEGVLYINHKLEMLNGGQIFGYRLPLETVAVTVRCPTDETVIRELMMAKSLGNLLRIHVHAENETPSGINDPRFAEYADQLGLYLIWQTSSWIREGEVWNVDIANYPVYMRQVYNHPSIVMWEASNHPNRFKKHGFSDSEDYINAIVPAITGTDSSRLVSPTSFWQHMHYTNYDGTLDIYGNTHAPNPWLMHRMMTRGSQDSYTGYENDWSRLRNFPSEFAKSCLDAKDLCYFNFEHEESIAQPNWELAKKDPWYKIPSYEKKYEVGNLGRNLDTDEWRESQGYQAFSAWESMKMQTLAGVCGFSWCSLESGPNMFTYHKPLVDPFYVPKLAFHANRMAFGRIWAASYDVDTVYGPGDSVQPVIFNMDGACRANLTVELQNEKGRVLERKVFKGVEVPEGRSVTRLDPFRFRNGSEGLRFLVYKLQVL
ncbi:MAG: glycosyl hydrolase family 2 [Bacteroidales bacterium]|nr:glycosyl hydrolase family 2 [Bacteroidales bacterium]